MYELGQILTLKKQHPCGASQFEVIRTGADIKLKCLGCGHVILLSYETVKKQVKSKPERQ